MKIKAPFFTARVKGDGRNYFRCYAVCLSRSFEIGFWHRSAGFEFPRISPFAVNSEYGQVRVGKYR